MVSIFSIKILIKHKFEQKKHYHLVLLHIWRTWEKWNTKLNLYEPARKALSNRKTNEIRVLKLVNYIVWCFFSHTLWNILVEFMNAIAASKILLSIWLTKVSPKKKSFNWLRFSAYDYAAANCKKFTQKGSSFLKKVWKGEKNNKSRFKIGETTIESINGICKLRFELWSSRWHRPSRNLVNCLSTNPTKWSNTLKQFVGILPTNRLSVFDHFVGLALKRLKVSVFDVCGNTILWNLINIFWIY